MAPWAMISSRSRPLRPHTKTSLYQPLREAEIFLDGSFINLQNGDYPHLDPVSEGLLTARQGVHKEGNCSVVKHLQKLSSGAQVS